MFSHLKGMPIGPRMLAAAILGAVVSIFGLYVFLVISDLQRSQEPDRAAAFLKTILNLAETIPFTVVATVFIASPLVVIALVIGHVFRNRIEEHPAVWCVAAPLVVWLMTSALLSLAGQVSFEWHLFFKRFLWMLGNGVTIAILLACVPPSALFYYLTVLDRPSGNP